jgi:hypothetical protein
MSTRINLEDPGTEFSTAHAGVYINTEFIRSGLFSNDAGCSVAQCAKINYDTAVT